MIPLLIKVWFCLDFFGFLPGTGLISFIYFESFEAFGILGFGIWNLYTKGKTAFYGFCLILIVALTLAKFMMYSLILCVSNSRFYWFL